jgi:hypothetical protein
VQFILLLFSLNLQKGLERPRGLGIKGLSLYSVLGEGYFGIMESKEVVAYLEDGMVMGWNGTEQHRDTTT